MPDKSHVHRFSANGKTSPLSKLRYSIPEFTSKLGVFFRVLYLIGNLHEFLHVIFTFWGERAIFSNHKSPTTSGPLHTRTYRYSFHAVYRTTKMHGWHKMSGQTIPCMCIAIIFAKDVCMQIAAICAVQNINVNAAMLICIFLPIAYFSVLVLLSAYYF